ncbi:MAG: FAD-dependent oxidoreductase [Candidatus Paceibacterota bacterium]
MLHDIAIIGGAGAGLTAAIYTSRKKLSTILIAKQVGGQCLLTDDIENYPGFEKISGIELMDKMRKQAEKYGVEIKEGSIVENIEKKNGAFLIKIKDGEDIETKAIILATGKNPRRLNVPGEKEFENKGVVFCSICDAPLFAGKDVVVAGGGNSGLHTALDLLNYANNIYILEAGPKIIGEEILQERLMKSGKVKFFTDTKITEIKGSNFVEKIIYEDKKTGDKKEISAQGIFISAGWTPATSFLSGFLNLNDNGEIIINPKTNETSVGGVFAAGDCTDVKYKQIIIAAGEGAKAALSAYDYLASKS